MRDDLLGEISLVVSPDNEHFASADINIGSSVVGWSDKGLTASIPISVKAKAQAHVHFNTAFVGGGIGTSLGINGDASSTLNMSASFTIRDTSAGRALVVQPLIECQRVAIDAVTDVNLGIIKATTVGIRLKKHVGGERMQPVILIDSLTRAIPFPHANIPEGSSIKWPSVTLTMTFDPKLATASATNLTLEAAASVSRSDQPLDTKEKKAELASALLAAAPTSNCSDPEEVAALIAGTEIGPNNEVVKWVGKALAEGKRVADETKKEIEKFAKTPLKSVTDAPGNVIRETGKGLDNVRREGERFIRCITGC
jgi:hypothetical protein